MDSKTHPRWVGTVAIEDIKGVDDHDGCIDDETEVGADDLHQMAEVVGETSSAKTARQILYQAFASRNLDTA